MLHFCDATVRWPEGASSLKSLRTVERAKTLQVCFVSASDPSGHSRCPSVFVLRTHTQDLLPDAQFRDLVDRLLEYDPARRITAADALQHSFFEPVRRERAAVAARAAEAVAIASARAAEAAAAGAAALSRPLSSGFGAGAGSGSGAGSAGSAGSARVPASPRGAPR
jgi:hypothetical protein